MLDAIPHEMLIIGGAAVGALITGNSTHELKALGGGFDKVFKGPKYNKQDYPRRHLPGLEADEDAAHRRPGRARAAYRGSEILGDLRRISAAPRQDNTLIHLICDTLRAGRRLVGHARPARGRGGDGQRDQDASPRVHEPADTLQSLADALPALGIVAAVLGVVKTMGSIDKPPAILGGMIGSALVGTFLGVLLAYGIVGAVREPRSSR